MAKPSDDDAEWLARRDSIIGLGERSVHKNYYPALRRNLSELKKLLEAVEQTTNGILICNHTGIIEYANPAMCAITGYQAGELIGRTPRLFWSDATPPSLYGDVFRTLAAGNPWQGELRHRRKSGTDFWNRVSITPVRDDAGAITHTIAVNEDISARKQAEAQILLAARVFSASSEGIVIADAAQLIVDANAAFEAMTGYGHDELVGRHIAVLRSDRHEQGFYDGVWAAVAATGEWKGEVWRKRKTGEVFLAQIALNLIRDETGTITHYMGMFSDTTERWRDAEKLREAKAELERRVEERTGELQATNHQLRAAKSLADQANLSKTRFLAAASHDLLQPLNAARIFGSILATRRLAAANKGLVRKSLAALDTVDEILKALLDISRFDAGAMPASPADVAVADLLSGLAEQCRVLAERKGLTLTFVPTSLAVHSDPALLARILRNFVGNAIRYTPEGGRVVVGCRRRPGSVLVGVWDNGPGVPADKMEEIFEEFRRLDHGGDKRDKGMGLGLAIVRRIARLLDHPLVVRSRVGAGSLFGVEVPRARAAPPAAAPPAAAPPRTALSVLRGARVAIVEDDADVQAAMCDLVRQWGCIPVAAASAAAILARLADATTPPDLMVADYHLESGELGLSAVAGLRRRFAAAIPAVVVTADASDATQRHVRDADCHFLAKPIRPARLGSLMAHLLRHRGEG